MWRRPLCLSCLAHLVLGLAFWLAADQIKPRELPSRKLDTRAHEEEINIMVSAIETRRPGKEEQSEAVEIRVADPPPPAASEETGRAGAVSPLLEASANDRSNRGQTPPARQLTTSFFQVGTQAQSVVYVIDRSGSMGPGGRLALARHEVIASLERLPASAKFQVIPYNRRAEPLRIDGKTDLVPATSANKEQAARLLEAVWPEGGTDHQPAFQAALRLQPEVIYFLTDADDLPADLVRTLTQQNHGRTVIHAIEMTGAHRDRLDMPLHVLARENRGSYQYVDVK